MLTSLQLSGILSNVAGVIVGRMQSCQADVCGWTVENLLVEKLSKLSVPVFINSMIGHSLPSQFILPIGTQVEMDADVGTITMLQPSTVAAILNVPLKLDNSEDSVAEQVSEVETSKKSSSKSVPQIEDDHEELLSVDLNDDAKESS
eukprot:TRINITY_DN5404_c0_g1_i3.p1 TRINITY_DN5404_c0_g1~~TRINITY_DN5404_c0_g1_i3.p1  ORF type:complete len:147 (-),score=39.82 TRINITY_DN5404_c0_g1_i3:100-540(-)